MWLKLANATFTTHLGAMSSLSNSISIRYTASGFSYTTGSVSKDATSASLELNLMSNWTCDSTPTVTVDGATKGTISYSSGKLTIPITPSSGSTFGASGVSSINITVTGAVSSGGSEGDDSSPPSDSTTPTGNTAHYQLNKNIYSDGLITDSSGAGRLAIVEFFPTNGAELTVSSSIATAAIAKRYYQADKSTMADSAASSVYGRVVLVVNTSGTLLSDVYEGETLTVNGTTYTLYNDFASDITVQYEVGANIGADGVVESNYSDGGRVAILHYFETNGTGLNVSYSNTNYAASVGIAKRYYDADKNGGATAATSTYGRIVLYNGTAETAIEENIEGTKIVVNSVSYTLSNA